MEINKMGNLNRIFTRDILRHFIDGKMVKYIRQWYGYLPEVTKLKYYAACKKVFLERQYGGV